MMKFLVVFLLVTVIVCEEAEIKTEENVIVVTKDNWDNVVTSDANVLVEFYAPWCGHCKSLAPEYAKAATKLKEDNSDVSLAKVDATIEKELAEKYGIKGFPTLKFFKKGTMMEYKAGRKSNDIVNWLNKKTGPPAKALEKADDVKAFVESKEVSVVGFFADEKSELALAFIKAAEGMDDIEFGITTPEASGDYGITEDKVVLFKKFDDLRADYTGEVDVAAITKFVRAESLALVTEFTDESAPKIFGGSIKSHLLFFMSKKAEIFPTTIETLRKVAKSFKGQVLFVSIDTDVSDNLRVLQFFQLKPEDCPAYRIVTLDGDMTKFVPETNAIDETAIATFVKDYVDGKLKAHMKTEEVPEDWDKAPVKVLVGKNFKEVVINGGKDAFVEFYAPWCGHCKKLMPIWDKLGEHYKDNDDIIIAKMDSTLNDIEEVKVKGFPTLKYFKKGEIVDYKGGRNFEDFVKFIEEQGIKTVTKEELSKETEETVTKEEPPKETEETAGTETKDEL